MADDENDDNPWREWAKGGDFDFLVEGTIVPKSFLPAVGYVVVCFSALDAQLDMTIAFLLGAEKEVGAAIVAGIPNYKPRIELFERLVTQKVKDDDDRKKLLRIAVRILAAADERHRLLHDYAGSLTGGLRKLGLRRKDSMFRKNKASTDFTKASLKELGAQMTDLSYRLQRYTKHDPRWKAGAQFPWRHRSPRRPRSC